jgi:hypothetical protein
MTDESGNENGNAYLINRFNDSAGTKVGVAHFSNNWFMGSVFLLINASLSDLLAKFHSLEHKIGLDRTNFQMLHHTHRKIS